MGKRIRKHARSNVVGYLALFVALGGTAAAVTQLDRNSVRSINIVNGQVKRPDIRADAVNSPKVAGDSLFGTDIDESSLQIDSVGGVRTLPLSFAQAKDTAATQLFDIGGLTATMECNSAISRVHFKVSEGAAANTVFESYGVAVLATGAASDTTVRAAGSVEGAGGSAAADSSTLGRVVLMSPTVTTIVDYAYSEYPNTLGTENDCNLRGILQIAPG